ncbi:hypothetical protein SAMN05445850_5719 [Paraburkholderia tuberum]|uniref:Uncharacterized protein n=1 Tax=Paraburkholderia tuberum TaxID=157910 RepID=A0A1H1JV34_9BURK|nr:hypothetical protein SAMN05445850_5719 [Paraburkholderia tuberum]
MIQANNATICCIIGLARLSSTIGSLLASYGLNVQVLARTFKMTVDFHQPITACLFRKSFINV